MPKPEQVRVPRTHIPKLNAVCTECGGACRTIMAEPFADGYHRRHKCRECDYCFYTLSPYEKGTPGVSPFPFKDRPLAEFEVARRVKWWTDAMTKHVAPTFDMPVVTSQGKEDTTYDPFIERIVLALDTPQEDRNEAETLIVQIYTALKQKVELIDAQANN
jgi:hypothetical protein